MGYYTWLGDLDIHVSLGLALVAMVLTVSFRALNIFNRYIEAWLILAGCLVIGAAFNGASFLHPWFLFGI